MLLDTSGLLCLLHRAETHHHRACAAYKAAERKWTSNYVVAELVALATVRRLPRPIVLSFIEDLLENPEITTLWVDETLHREALRLLSNRKDKHYSLCDAVSFVSMRRFGVNEALTTDHHFEQEGFRILLR